MYKFILISKKIISFFLFIFILETVILGPEKYPINSITNSRRNLILLLVVDIKEETPLLIVCDNVCKMLFFL